MSDYLYAPRLRPERLIAAGRVVLAASSLFAVWLDPTEPVRFPALAYGMLVAYGLYALTAAALIWRVETVSTVWPVVTHAVDLICFSLFIFFTEGPASPFTVYFVFALLSATLRWQARGTLWTAVVVLAAFFGFGAYFGFVLQDPDFDLRALIIRGVYLVVLAGLLGYVGAEDQRTLREMWRLASWPQAVRPDAESLSRDLLAHAGSLLDVPRVVLVWAEPDAPWRRLALWEATEWTVERLPADERLVDAAIGDLSFICSGGPVRRTLVQTPGAPQLTPWHGSPIAPDFARRYASGPVISLPLSGESVEGRLFFVGRADATLDDLVLAEIVAGVMAARLDAYYLTEQLQQAAATEERIRLARDLHDGVLQSFTGIALRLAAIRRLMSTDRAAATEALEDVQRLLASEQRDVRFFIEELKPKLRPAEDTALEIRLAELVQRMEREWDMRVELDVAGADYQHLSSSLCREVYHIIREALMNAARHGAASAARVTIAGADDHALRVTIADNGRGFAFTGRYSADDLAKLNLGPKTLRERVRAMNGSLTLESGSAGAELDVVLPLAAVA